MECGSALPKNYLHCTLVWNATCLKFYKAFTLFKTEPDINSVSDKITAWLDLKPSCVLERVSLISAVNFYYDRWNVTLALTNKPFLNGRVVGTPQREHLRKTLKMLCPLLLFGSLFKGANSVSVILSDVLATI